MSKKCCADAEQARKVIDGYSAGDQASLIHALQDVQTKFGYVPADVAGLLCDHLDVPISKAFSVVTFYRAFSLEPKGEVVIRVCTGTACRVRGAQILVDEIVAALGIKPGSTTEDLKFTLETVNCVGPCAMAPVVSLNGEYRGNVKPGEMTKKIQGGK